VNAGPYKQRVKQAASLAIYAMENNDAALFPLAIERLRGVTTGMGLPGMLAPAQLDYTDKPSFLEFLLKKLEVKNNSELAKQLNVSRQAVSIWETRQRIPSTGMEKLRARFGAERIDLLVKEYEEAFL